MDKQYDLDNEIEIDLKSLLLQLLSSWKIIFLAAVIAGGLAYAYSSFMVVPQYESTSELYVLTKSTSITSLADIQTGSSLTNDYIVIVKGRPVLDQVITNLQLNESYKTLYSKISLENPSNSRVLKITVTDADPNMAKAIADEVADVASAYIAEKMEQDPPNIIQKGYADGQPVSPNVIKNTALGVMAGLVLSMAVIVLTSLFNDTITTPEDVEKKLGLNVLGTLPLEESEADDYTPKKKKKKKGKK